MLNSTTKCPSAVTMLYIMPRARTARTNPLLSPNETQHSRTLSVRCPPVCVCACVRACLFAGLVGWLLACLLTNMLLLLGVNKMQNDNGNVYRRERIHSNSKLITYTHTFIHSFILSFFLSFLPSFNNLVHICHHLYTGYS